MREKKCKNCILCLEDVKDLKPDILIKDLNERLVTKTARIAQLEDHVRKSTTLINQISTHSFSLLRSKTADFVKNLDASKQKYELQLMEYEEKFILEQKQCQTVINNRVKALEEKYTRMRT